MNPEVQRILAEDVPVNVPIPGVDPNQLYTVLAIVIVAAIIIGIYRSLPKWLLVVIVIIGLGMAGIIKFQ